jgi:intraflagellar transport protein 140
MKDFNGLDIIDELTVTAIMNFNFYLSIGNLDEAYKSVKQVQNPMIWENMA